MLLSFPLVHCTIVIKAVPLESSWLSPHFFSLLLKWHLISEYFLNLYIQKDSISALFFFETLSPHDILNITHAHTHKKYSNMNSMRGRCSLIYSQCLLALNTYLNICEIKKCMPFIMSEVDHIFIHLLTILYYPIL
ncbi:hypothetical protein HJG60_012254 [Phyllostomus discolor]|uniref:Uncharacterized protein n=1 Tax=Phyllostomus discolor TaxID=89673 RepID=A0A834DUS9_9CHIR|nr:hypothetical protein HJG60_012254 [Phyllostomus discolor]